MSESGILKCAPCIAYRADRANDAWTIAGGQALCKEHLVVLERRGDAVRTRLHGRPDRGRESDVSDHRAEARRIVWSGPLAQQVLAKDWLLRRRQVRANPEHVCDTPFWRTEDSRWECSECGRRYVWTRTVRTVPGVPASACTVYENRWEETP